MEIPIRGVTTIGPSGALRPSRTAEAATGLPSRALVDPERLTELAPLKRMRGWVIEAEICLGFNDPASHHLTPDFRYDLRPDQIPRDRGGVPTEEPTSKRANQAFFPRPRPRGARFGGSAVGAGTGSETTATAFLTGFA